MSSPERKIIIIAGPNGAGKTTFAREFLPGENACSTFINADLIAAGLNPFNPDDEAFRAGRLMLELIRNSVDKGISFAIETTLSGRAYAGSVVEWKKRGYSVNLYYLRLPTSEMAIERVRLRVKSGGHNIPAPVVHRRFQAGWDNLQTTFRHLADEWAIFDTSGPDVQMVDSGKNTADFVRQSESRPPGPLPDCWAGAASAIRRAAIGARQRALETNGEVMLYRDRALVLETDPKRIFPSGVEVEICRCGRVIATDTLDGTCVSR